MELRIDPEFQRIAPPLRDAEYRLLESSILEKGCLDPILVWGITIIDGKYRYMICKKHGIPFPVRNIEFTGRDEAKIWIAKKQLGRRNLNAFQRCEMVLPLEPELAAEAEKRRREAIRKYRMTGETSAKGCKTRDVMAELAGVSFDTLQKVKTILAMCDDETIRKARDGAVSINWAYKQTQSPAEKKPAGISDAERLAWVTDGLQYLLDKIDTGMMSQQATREEIIQILRVSSKERIWG